MLLQVPKNTPSLLLQYLVLVYEGSISGLSIIFYWLVKGKIWPIEFRRNRYKQKPLRKTSGPQKKLF